MISTKQDQQLLPISDSGMLSKAFFLLNTSLTHANLFTQAFIGCITLVFD